MTENIQISAAYQYVHVKPDVGDSHNDFGNPAVGVKWRFWNADRLQLAVAPAYSFGVSGNRARRGLADDEDALFVPLELEYSFGDWTLNGEFGYVSVKNESDELGYGAAISHPVGASTQVFFELYGGSDSDFDNDVLNFHVAFDHGFSGAWHLLFAIGSGLVEPDGSEELDLDLYLGLQFFR